MDVAEDCLRMGLSRMELAGAATACLLEGVCDDVPAMAEEGSSAMRGTPTPARGLTVALRDADRT